MHSDQHKFSSIPRGCYLIFLSKRANIFSPDLKKQSVSHTRWQGTTWSSSAPLCLSRISFSFPARWVCASQSVCHISNFVYLINIRCSFKIYLLSKIILRKYLSQDIDYTTIHDELRKLAGNLRKKCIGESNGAISVGTFPKNPLNRENRCSSTRNGWTNNLIYK